MIVALFAGVVMVLVGRNFEEALSKKLELVFFIPVIVYISDCIGTETLALFVRELAVKEVNSHQLFWRETAVGISLGLVTGIPMGLFSYLWLGDLNLGCNARYRNDCKLSRSRTNRDGGAASVCKAQERSRAGNGRNYDRVLGPHQHACLFSRCNSYVDLKR
jgi:hypothetical protein